MIEGIEGIEGIGRRRLLGAAVFGWTQGAFAASAAPATVAAVSAIGGGGTAPLRVVASFSILADMVRNVAGDAADVATLVGPDSDAHVFEPTPLHARRLADAELVVVNGLGFEGWMPRLIAASGYRGPVIVASEGVRLRSLGQTIDPHVWQALANGQQMAQNIRRGVQSAHSASHDVVAQRCTAYVDALGALDRNLRARFDRIPADRRRVITSHDAFGYFGAAYGIQFETPLGTSTESEPSAATVARLAGLVRSQAIRAIFIENISDPRLVRRLAEDAGAVLGGRLYSDALSRPGGEADTYLKLYAHNANTIATALGA